MATTSPDGIGYITTADNVTPSVESSAQATTIQTAFSLRQRYEFVWANSAARIAQAGMVASSIGYQIDTKSEYIYDSGAWRLKLPYGEWTTASQAVIATTFFQPITTTLVTANTTDSTFVSITGGVVTFVSPGIYSVTWIASSGTGTSTSFLGIYDSLARTNIFAVGPFTANVGQVNLVYRTASANFQMWLWGRMAANDTITSTIRIARLG